MYGPSGGSLHNSADSPATSLSSIVVSDLVGSICHGSHRRPEDVHDCSDCKYCMQCCMLSVHIIRVPKLACSLSWGPVLPLPGFKSTFSALGECAWRPSSLHLIVIIITDGESCPCGAVQAEVIFAHTASYPDEPPLLKARRCVVHSDTLAMQTAQRRA